jgi:ComF family protein
MFLTHTAHNFYDSLLSILYPQPCVICGNSVESRTHVPACISCWNQTSIFEGTESLCWKCGLVIHPAGSPVDPCSIRCHQCDEHLFAAARACGVYELALREAVLQLKRQPHLASYIVSFLVRMAQRPPLNQATRIIPVPLHPQRERQRGFNQAAVIARAIGPLLDLVVDESVLTRVVASHKYRAGLDQKGRFDSVANAFDVRFPSIVKDEVILLVDDVLTTGATASSCAATLLSAGARQVVVLTLARPAN